MTTGLRRRSWILARNRRPGLPADTDTGELRAGGRGLWLLQRLVDEVRLERVELGTRVTLRRAIRPAGILAR
jgi:anti-sigma regulatory factor (Ser/Thr protein kinase)